MKKPVIRLVPKKPEAKKGDDRFAGIDAAIARCETLTDELTPDEAAIFTASKLQLPTPYLSPTQIEMYLKCPTQYKIRYIDGKKSPPAVAMVEGTTHHSALELNNKTKAKTGKDLLPKTMFECFADHWVKNRKEIEDWEGEKPDDIIRRGRKIIDNYLRTFAPTLIPRRSERTTCVPVGPIKLLAIVDCDGHVLAPGRKAPTATDHPVVCDYKTVGRARTEKDVASSVQLSICSYAHATDFKEEKHRVGFCSLLKTTGQVKWESLPTNPGRIAWMRRLVVSVANGISHGHFPLAMPDQWWCSERFCGFWKQCRGKCEK